MDQKSLMQLANERAFAQLEERWMDALTSAPAQLDELLRVAAWLVKARELDRAQTLLDTLLEALHELNANAELLTAAQQALSWFPDNPSFRSYFLHAFPAAHPDNPLAADIAAASGLAKGAPLNASMEFIARRSHLRPGLFAIHRMRRIAVRLESYDPFSDILSLSDGSHTFSANLVTFLDQYDPLDDNDFRAMSIFCRPALAQLAQADPAELTIRYLKVSGRSSTFRDFKETLTHCAVPPDDWKRWWQAAKPILVAHPLIDLGEGAQPSLTLRDTPREASLSWRTDFSFAAHPRVQPAVVLRYAAHLADGIPPDPALLELFNSGLAPQADTPPARAFAAWLALTSLACATNAQPPAYNPAWLASQDACQIFAQWCGWESVYIAPFIATLPSADPDWPQRFAAILPFAPIALVEQIAHALRSAQHHDLLNTTLASLAVPSPQTAEAFAWLWRSLASDPASIPNPPLDIESATLTLFKLIQQLGSLQHAAEQNLHAALATLRHTLATKHYSLIRAIMRQFGAARAADLYQIVMSNTGLSTPMRSQLVAIVSDIAANR